MGLLMNFVLKALLRILHLIYLVYLFAHSVWKRQTWTPPHPLNVTRRRIPKHLALLLVVDPGWSAEVSEEALIQCVTDVVGWCRRLGIEKLTAYEEQGFLLSGAQRIRERLPVSNTENDTSESEIEYPLTPPPSDYSESRPLSPQHDLRGVVPTISMVVADKVSRKKSSSKLLRRRQRPDAYVNQNQLTLCLISKEASKAAIASVSRSLVRSHCENKPTKAKDAFKITVDELDVLLESSEGLSSPDFMIVHHISPIGHSLAPLELYNFPPWHIRLTEIYRTRISDTPQDSWIWSTNNSRSPTLLDETVFREALDEFSSAEMRFGK